MRTKLVARVSCLGGLGLWGLISMSGCAHKQAPPPTPPPPPAPKGDLLRIHDTANASTRSKVNLVIDQSSTGKQARKVSLNFNFAAEEKTESVSGDGLAQISARMVDVVGSSAVGANQDAVDQWALALDELKVGYRRNPRGEVDAMTLSGVKPPLDEKTARMITNAVFGGQRGALLPAEPVATGATWTVAVSLPAPQGAEVMLNYSYKYTAVDSGVATVSIQGTVQMTGDAPAKMTGTDAGTYQLRMADGTLVHSDFDLVRQLESTTPGNGMSVMSHVHVVWELQPPAGGNAPAAASGS